MKLKKKISDRKLHWYGSHLAETQVVESPSKIKWTKITNIHTYKKTEAYIQHYLFHELLKHGICCIPEFTDGHNRYDIMVLKKNKPICIVEVKSSPRYVNDEQYEDYKKNSFGVPVMLLVGRDDFYRVVFDIIRLYRSIE